jgi:hypothetical protein
MDQIGAGVALTKDWKTERSGLDSRQGKRIFPLPSVSRLALGPTQPTVQWVPGSFPQGKVQPGRDADHAPPSSVKAKNE